MLKKLFDKEIIIYQISPIAYLISDSSQQVERKTIKIVISKLSKNKLNPENFRPISLLTTISKLFERSIQIRF